MRTLIRNLRYSLRTLRKNPGLTVAIIATLMLGIGATTAIYTVVYAVLLAPLPYPHPEQLVMVWSKVNGGDNGMSAGDFLDWREQNKTFQQMAAFTRANFNLATQDQPEPIDGMRCTPGWFNLQGIPFLMGRDLLPGEDIPGKDHEVVLTHRLWNRLGANRGILNQPLAVVVLAAITAAGAIVWLVALRFLTMSARRPSADQQGAAEDPELAAPAPAGWLSGSVEVEGEPGTLAARSSQIHRK